MAVVSKIDMMAGYVDAAGFMSEITYGEVVFLGECAPPSAKCLAMEGPFSEI